MIKPDEPVCLPESCLSREVLAFFERPHAGKALLANLKKLGRVTSVHMFRVLALLSHWHRAPRVRQKSLMEIGKMLRSGKLVERNLQSQAVAVLTWSMVNDADAAEVSETAEAVIRSMLTGPAQPEETDHGTELSGADAELTPETPSDRDFDPKVLGTVRRHSHKRRAVGLRPETIQSFAESLAQKRLQRTSRPAAR